MSRIKRISYAITPEGHRANAIKQAIDLRDRVLSIVDDSNFSTSTARKITKKAAFSVVMRSLEASKRLPLSLREHLAMKELNNYIALAKHNKSDFFYATNTDLLPISHPRSTREHSMTASALRISRSRWFAADPRITDERAKAVLASAFESVPGSVEHLYYSSILLSLPQGIVPGDALIAATDGNSSESRSARARRQRRDRKGRFAYEGGGIRALIRRASGEIFSISGRVVANAKNSRDVEVEFPDGKIAQVNPAKGEYVKAVLPTPDGYSPKPIVPSVSDEVINEKDLVFLDAPNGWVKDEAFKDFGDKVERYVDSNKEFVVFASKKDDGTKDYQILNAKSAEEIDVVNTWAEVQDRLEGKEDQILNPKARLPKQQAAPVETEGGFEYNYPDKAYKIRQDSEYDVQGRVDEESPDFTDDPVELAQNQDERDLLAALEQAVSPGEGGENALGVGALPFGKGDEFVPAEAIFFALQEAGMDAPMELAKIYDKKLGNNANEKALNDFRKKEEVVSGNTPELAESFKKVTEQNPDLEPPTEEPKFDAKKADLAPLPALLEGLSEKELEQFMETKDHIPYLPKNEEIEMPQSYNPLSPEPFAAWKEVTAENPDAILPEGFSDNPVYLAQEIPTNDLLKELRRSVEPGNEVPGAAVIALPTEDGEDFVANVPGEAVRDALQLKGVDTNAELKKIADEGFAGQKDEPIASVPTFPVRENYLPGAMPDAAGRKRAQDAQPGLPKDGDKSYRDPEKAIDMGGLGIKVGDRVLHRGKYKTVKRVDGEGLYRMVFFEEEFPGENNYLVVGIKQHSVKRPLENDGPETVDADGEKVIKLDGNRVGTHEFDGVEMKKVFGKWVMVNGMGGRKFGKYDTLEDAVKAIKESRGDKPTPVAELPLDTSADTDSKKLPDGYFIYRKDSEISPDLAGISIEKDGEEVGFLFWNKETKVIENVEIKREHRGNKLAKSAWDAAKEIEPELKHAEYRTPAGDKFAHSTGDVVPPLKPIGDWTQKDLDEAQARAESKEQKAELPVDMPVEKKPMNAYERLMAEQKAEAEAVEERVAKLKKDAEDRVDEQGRSVPEGWGFIAKNRPNFGQVDRPDNYFNVYGNNNFEASVDADGKITVKDRNGLLPDKSYDNWEDLQADLENQKSEYSAAARERVREIAKKYGYSDEQIAAFDSMSQQELADFFANPENHTKAYTEALDDLANSSAIDLPNPQQKARWAQMRKDEKILAQAGDAPSKSAENPLIQKPALDRLVLEIDKNDGYEANGLNFRINTEAFGAKADNIEVTPINWEPGDPIVARIDMDGGVDWENDAQYDKYAEAFNQAIQGLNPPKTADPLKESKELSEGDKAVIKNNAFVEENAGTLQPTEARNLKVGDFMWNAFFGRYEEILAMEPADMGRIKFTVFNVYNNKEEVRYFEMDSPLRNVRRPGIEDQAEPIPSAKAAPRGGKRKEIKRKPLGERIVGKEGRKVGGNVDAEGFYKDENGVPLKPGDVVVYHEEKNEKAKVWKRGVVKALVGAQVTEGEKAGAMVRKGVLYLDNLIVQWEGEDAEWAIKQGGREMKAKNLIRQEGEIGDIPLPDFRGGRAVPNAGRLVAPDAIADDFKFAVPLMEPVVRKDKDEDLEEQIRRAMDAGDEVSFNYNGKTRYVKPVKIWKNPVNNNVNVTAVENGEIKNFTISKMGYIEDPEGAALKRPAQAPAPEAKVEVPEAAEDKMNEIVAPTFDAIDEKQIRDGIADIVNQIRLRRDFYSKKGGWEGKTNAGTIDNAEVAIKAFSSSFNVDNPAEWEVEALEKAARRIRRVGEGMEPLADALDNLKKILKDEKRRAVLDKAAPEVAEIDLELGNNFADLENKEEIIKGFKFIAGKLPKEKNYRAPENLRKARGAIDSINEAFDSGAQVDEIKDYNIDIAIRRLDREIENPVATILAEKLKALQKDLETQRQALIDKRLNMPLPELPPVENIDNAGFEKVVNEIIQRMPRKGNDSVVGIRFQLANYVLPRVKNGFIDIEDLPLPELDKAINDLRNVGGLDAKYSEFADILEKYKKDIDSRGGQDGAIGAEPVNKINPEEVANQRVAENANAFGADENVRKILADDLVVDNDPLLQPFAEEIKEFFADAEPKALAKLSAPARQALNKFVAKTLKDPNKAAFPSDPDERKAAEQNLANLAFQLREEKLAFAPNSNDLGVGNEILDIDVSEMKKFADFLLNNSIDRARLKINGQKTAFDIIPFKGDDKGVNITYMLIHRETGRKFIIKKDTMVGERGADAEIASAKLALALNIAGAYKVVRHNKNKDVVITAYAGEMLDLVEDPKRVGDTKFVSDHSGAARQGALVDVIGLAIMDAILVNGDRHRSNLLVGRLKNLEGVNDPDNLEEVQFMPIDHGLAAIIVRGRNESPENYIDGASGDDSHRRAVNIAAKLIDLIGVDVYKQINDMTIQQAVQALQRERGSDISDADLDLIISRLELLRGIDNSKWKQILKKR